MSAVKNKKIGFIGGGNMAEAILKGMLSSKLVKASNIFVSEPNKSRQTFLTNEFKVKAVKGNLDLLKKAVPRRKRVNLRPEGNEEGVLIARVTPLDADQDLGFALVTTGLATPSCNAG